MLLHRMSQDSERRQWGTAYEDRGLVFAQENGRPYDPGKITKISRPWRRRPACVTSDFTTCVGHGAASLMLAAGIPVGVVSKRLGHSSISLTNDTIGTYLRVWVGTRLRLPRHSSRVCRRTRR